jgi:hypothetical protein
MPPVVILQGRATLIRQTTAAAAVTTPPTTRATATAEVIFYPNKERTHCVLVVRKLSGSRTANQLRCPIITPERQ